ncbi:MAG: lipoate--protein ligase [Thermodesulfobacteriota bacterium]|nr:lipoate--protein ligase [Thermodesulfobacteriota bacterium]
MGTWRLFKDIKNTVSTNVGLSIDDTLPLSISQNGSQPILHLYKFKPSAIVGKYQDIEAALKLDRCRERGVEFNRRSTGGGTVIMGPKVVALGLGISIDDPGLKKGIQGIFESMSAALIQALQDLGVEAGFRPKNDIEIDGKKLAGLSASLETEKAILFHASLLVDFDIPLMMDIMNQPPLKLYDKGYSCFSQRITTIKEQLCRDIDIETVVESIENSFQQRFSASFERDKPNRWEEKIINDFIDKRYSSPDWIFSHKHPRSKMCLGELKTPGGLLEIYLSMAGSTIERIIITGDFFSTTKDINLLESALKWTSSKGEKIEEHLKEVWREDMIHGVDVGVLTEAILKAKENALPI